MRLKSFLFAGTFFLSAVPSALALDADPYCVTAPTPECILEIVASGFGSLRPGYDADDVLSDYGRALAYLGRLDEAQAVADRIVTERSRNNVLKVLAGMDVSLADDDAGPDRLVENMDATKRVVEYAMLAEAAFRGGKTGEAQTLLDHAKTAAREVEADTNAPHGHYRLASALEMAGEDDASVQAARAIINPTNRAITLIELANRKAKQERKETAFALIAEAAALREEIPADKHYLPISREAEFWIHLGETDRALELARSATSERVRKSVLSSLIDTAARSGHWELARDLADEADAHVQLATVFAYCAGSFAAESEPGPNTCMNEAYELLEELGKDGKVSERDRVLLDHAIISLAVAESFSDNPKAVRKLLTTLPDDNARRHAQFQLINAQTGRNNQLAIAMALNMSGLDDQLQALARMARFLAADANR